MAYCLPGQPNERFSRSNASNSQLCRSQQWEASGCELEKSKCGMIHSKKVVKWYLCHTKTRLRCIHKKFDFLLGKQGVQDVCDWLKFEMSSQAVWHGNYAAGHHFQKRSFFPRESPRTRTFSHQISSQIQDSSPCGPPFPPHFCIENKFRYSPEAW